MNFTKNAMYHESTSDYRPACWKRYWFGAPRRVRTCVTTAAATQYNCPHNFRKPLLLPLPLLLQLLSLPLLLLLQLLLQLFTTTTATTFTTSTTLLPLPPLLQLRLLPVPLLATATTTTTTATDIGSRANETLLSSHSRVLVDGRSQQPLGVDPHAQVQPFPLAFDELPSGERARDQTHVQPC